LTFLPAFFFEAIGHLLFSSLGRELVWRRVLLEAGPRAVNRER
jgi:hypothetical protein